MKTNSTKVCVIQSFQLAYTGDTFEGVVVGSTREEAEKKAKRKWKWFEDDSKFGNCHYTVVQWHTIERAQR